MPRTVDQSAAERAYEEQYHHPLQPTRPGGFGDGYIAGFAAAEAASRERIAKLEAALRGNWLYDSYQCNVCLGERPFGSRIDERVEHEVDCIILTLSALAEQEDAGAR